MRALCLLPLLALILPAFATPLAAGEAFLDVRTFEAEDFAGPRDVFPGFPQRGDRWFWRSTGDERGGHYWILLPRGSFATGEARTIELIVQFRGSIEEETFLVSLPEGAGLKREWWIGVTGRPGREHPVAWSLRVLDAESRVLFSRRSFLMPDHAE